MDRVGDLEITQDLRFQQREWNAQRVSWAALVLVVVLAAVGLFGHGPISWTTKSSSDGSLEVSFERFSRRGGSHGLVIRGPSGSAEDGSWEIDVSRDYLSVMEVDSVSPEPESVETVEDALRYTFTQDEPGADLEVTFSLTPDGLWDLDGRISLADGAPVHISQFLFPWERRWIS